MLQRKYIVCWLENRDKVFPESWWFRTFIALLACTIFYRENKVGLLLRRSRQARDPVYFIGVDAPDNIPTRAQFAGLAGKIDL